MENLSPIKSETILSDERVVFYEKKAKDLLKKYGKKFDKFVENYSEIAQEGDTFLGSSQCSGYNILPSAKDMDLTSDENCIFYSNYIRRTRHFGLLLAEMEQKKIITSDQVKFGVKASKVRYGLSEERRWKINKKDEVLEPFNYFGRDGKTSLEKADKTVEIVVAFSNLKDISALNIARFLSEKTDARIPSAIAGSWVLPDIRATASLKSVLLLDGLGFTEAVANVLDKDGSNLIVLKKQTEFNQIFPKKGWRSKEIEMGQGLATFLTYFGEIDP